MRDPGWIGVVRVVLRVWCGVWCADAAPQRRSSSYPWNRRLKSRDLSDVHLYRSCDGRTPKTKNSHPKIPPIRRSTAHFPFSFSRYQRGGDLLKKLGLAVTDHLGTCRLSTSSDGRCTRSRGSCRSSDRRGAGAPWWRAQSPTPCTMPLPAEQGAAPRAGLSGRATGPRQERLRAFPDSHPRTPASSSSRGARRRLCSTAAFRRRSFRFAP